MRFRMVSMGFCKISASFLCTYLSYSLIISAVQCVCPRTELDSVALSNWTEQRTLIGHLFVIFTCSYVPGNPVLFLEGCPKYP